MLMNATILQRITKMFVTQYSSRVFVGFSTLVILGAGLAGYLLAA